MFVERLPQAEDQEEGRDPHASPEAFETLKSFRQVKIVPRIQRGTTLHVACLQYVQTSASLLCVYDIARGLLPAMWETTSLILPRCHSALFAASSHWCGGYRGVSCIDVRTYIGGKSQHGHPLGVALHVYSFRALVLTASPQARRWTFHNAS